MRSHLSLLSLLLLSSPALAWDGEFDLKMNLPLAHIYEGGVVADASVPGFVKYLRDKRNRWKRGVKLEGRSVAYAPGLQANLWIPVGAELKGKELVLEAIIHPFGKGQRMDLFLEGKKISSPKLKKGWQLIRKTLKPKKTGLLKVRLHFRKATNQGGFKTAVAIRAIRLGLASTPALPLDETHLMKRLSRSQGDQLRLPAQGGLDWYLTPPPKMSLKGESSAPFELSYQLDQKKPKSLKAGKNLGVDLSKLGGEAVRLMLRGKQETLIKGKIFGKKGGAEFKRKKPKYVIFWLIDTLRSDKLKFYDYPNTNNRKVKTPNLDKFAKDSTIFEPFYIQGNESKASHASLFTGMYPVAHKVYTEKAKLSNKFTTIAEAFKTAGYYTQGFCSNGYISKKWNFTQGFNAFTNFIRESKAHNAAAVNKAAFKWIDKFLKKRPNDSFYLYLGTTDPHVTYRMHKDFIGDYSKLKYKGSYKKYLSGQELGKIKGRKNPPSAKNRKRIEALYENEIAFNDHHFGRLVAYLKEKGIYDQTLILITGDHGDEFWEHGSCGHGHSVHQELVNVPMLMRLPGVFPAKKVRSGAEAVDLLPTLMDLLGQKIPKEVQGESWLRLINADGAWPQAILASQGRGTYALAVGRAKVIMSSEASIKIYDLKKDPGELKNLFSQRTILSLAALDPLSIFFSRAKSWNKHRWGPPNNLREGF